MSSPAEQTAPVPEVAESLYREARAAAISVRRPPVGVLRVLRRADLDQLPEPSPLIADVLPSQGLAMLAGSRALGKSLLTLDMAGHVAQGRSDWCGHAVTHHGPVAYVALEGFFGVPERVRAWEVHHGTRLSDVVWLPDRFNACRDDHVDAVGEFAAAEGVVMVVVDSVRASGAGAEDTRDMSIYVNGMERLRDAFGGLVLVLHNTGWDDSRERGSTLLPDACDTTLLLKKRNGSRALTATKQRDADPMDLGCFDVTSVPGTSSAVMVVSNGGGSSLASDLLAAVADRPGSSGSELASITKRNRSNVSTELNRLQDQGRVENRGGGSRACWFPVGGDSA